MQRVIVTGATGMIGWNLIEYLIGHRIEVLAIVNPNSIRKGCLPKHDLVRVLECDLDNIGTLQPEGVYDVFFHLGWKGTYGTKREDVILQEQNVRIALEAVELASKVGCSIFVGAGSQAEYGSNYHVKLTGDLPAKPETGYGIGKYMAGLMTRKRCAQLGIRHEWVRILSIYGPGDGSHTMIMSGIEKLLKGAPPQYTKAEQQWDYLYVRDAVEALYLIAKNGVDGKIYCLGSGKTRELKDYIFAIRDAVSPQLQVNIGHLPYNSNQVMYLCADISELCEDTGFVVKTSFEEGIKETIRWVREKDLYEEN